MLKKDSEHSQTMKSGFLARNCTIQKRRQQSVYRTERSKSPSRLHPHTSTLQNGNENCVLLSNTEQQNSDLPTQLKHLQINLKTMNIVSHKGGQKNNKGDNSSLRNRKTEVYVSNNSFIMCKAKIVTRNREIITGGFQTPSVVIYRRSRQNSGKVQK